ncbi:hypothetical protein IF2G_01662 [Cordyceps javanica]|nr:hypothetical protein IF2G_01662 [Cordyceps javanica]
MTTILDLNVSGVTSICIQCCREQVSATPVGGTEPESRECIQGENQWPGSRHAHTKMYDEAGGGMAATRRCDLIQRHEMLQV